MPYKSKVFSMGGLTSSLDNQNTDFDKDTEIAHKQRIIKQVSDKLNEPSCTFPFYINLSNDKENNKKIINALKRRGYIVSYV